MSRADGPVALPEFPYVRLGGQRGFLHGCHTDIGEYVLRGAL